MLPSQVVPDGARFPLEGAKPRNLCGDENSPTINPTGATPWEDLVHAFWEALTLLGAQEGNLYQFVIWGPLRLEIKRKPSGDHAQSAPGSSAGRWPKAETLSSPGNYRPPAMRNWCNTPTSDGGESTVLRLHPPPPPSLLLTGCRRCAGAEPESRLTGELRARGKPGPRARPPWGVCIKPRKRGAEPDGHFFWSLVRTPGKTVCSGTSRQVPRAAVLRKVIPSESFQRQVCLVTRNICLQSLKLGVQGRNVNDLGNQKLIKLGEPLNDKK